MFFAICLVHSCRKSNQEIGKLFVSHETSNADIDVPVSFSVITKLTVLFVGKLALIKSGSLLKLNGNGTYLCSLANCKIATSQVVSQDLTIRKHH